ncbi:hypothetical protein PIB30_071405, partial [Stylosanthes scabra]|nr:hypothetical protein [Stylosanthes scabra]
SSNNYLARNDGGQATAERTGTMAPTRGKDRDDVAATRRRPGHTDDSTRRHKRNDRDDNRCRWRGRCDYDGDGFGALGFQPFEIKRVWGFSFCQQLELIGFFLKTRETMSFMVFLRKPAGSQFGPTVQKPADSTIL